jgi:hypothetical protein
MGLDQAYRAKVLQPRAGFQRDEWTPIPALRWVDQQAGADLNERTKLFLRWFMAATDATLAGPVQFVVLLRVDVADDAIDFSLVCPFAEPLAVMRQGAAATRPPDYLRRITELEIRYRFGLLAEMMVPVVVDCDRTTGRYAFANANHLDDPRQFINPQFCRTSSGMLNFLGAAAIDGAEMRVMSALGALEDQGLDEWFRWLYCLTETGVNFDPDRMLVHGAEPERWIYDYDG